MPAAISRPRFTHDTHKIEHIDRYTNKLNGFYVGEMILCMKVHVLFVCTVRSAVYLSYILS